MVSTLYKTSHLPERYGNDNGSNSGSKLPVGNYLNLPMAEKLVIGTFLEIEIYTVLIGGEPRIAGDKCDLSHYKRADAYCPGDWNNGKDAYKQRCRQRE